MRMLGNSHFVGWGGKDCACCYEAPGKARKRMNRTKKRQERQQWRKEAKKEMS